jgi:hypothetical protein
MRRPHRTLASSLLIVAALSAATFADTTLVYDASFVDGSTEPSVDQLGLGSMQAGDSQIPDSNPTATPGNGEIVLGVTRPASLASGVVSSGMWVTPVNFDQGSVVGLQARFVRPSGPSSGGWAVGVGARTGDQNDLGTDTRVTANLTSRAGGTARLQVPFGATSQTNIDVPPAMYDAIFRTDDPEAFTLGLLVDRKLGNATASLTVDGFPVLSRSFQLKDFQATQGPVITAVGAAIANGSASGQTVTVHLRDFRIYVGKQRCPQSQPRCVSGLQWGRR